MKEKHTEKKQLHQIEKHINILSRFISLFLLSHASPSLTLLHLSSFHIIALVFSTLTNKSNLLSSTTNTFFQNNNFPDNFFLHLHIWIHSYFSKKAKMKIRFRIMVVLVRGFCVFSSWFFILIAALAEQPKNKNKKKEIFFDIKK